MESIIRVPFLELESNVSYLFQSTKDNNHTFIGRLLCKYCSPPFDYEQIIFKERGNTTEIASPFSFYSLQSIEPSIEDRYRKKCLIEELNASPPGFFGDLKLKNAPGGKLFFESKTRFETSRSRKY